jgi:hypothetical protein
MSIEETTFKAEQLGFQIAQNEENHKKLFASIKSEAQDIHRRILALKSSASKTETDKVAKAADDIWTRRVDWQIDNCSKRFENLVKNESIWSPEFSMLGFTNLQLEFFPKGRESTWLDGFCSVFLWCPAGVRVKYQLRVGEYTAAPDEDEYASRMGHGHSNFCLLEAQIDKESDTLSIGLDVLNLSGATELPGGIKLHTTSPEGLIDKEANILRHRDVDTIEWKIAGIRKRAEDVPQGLAICSPIFSAAGVGEMLMEFYPNGIKGSTKEGFCGFYLRCPSGTSLIITLFVGSSQKGPIKTDFDGNAAKGLPEFCHLQGQLLEGQEDLVVGIKLRNPVLEKEETINSVLLSSEDSSFDVAS